VGGGKVCRVYVEVGKRLAFACALDWPGWCRSGKGEGAALEALAAYAERYRPVAVEVGVAFPSGARAVRFEVVEHVAGSSTTDFGAPDRVPSADHSPLSAADAARHAALVSASWATFDRVVAGAPSALRKGPRGGGRDRDAIVDHVVAGEVSYARKLGIRHPSGAPVAVAELRAGIVDVLRSSRSGAPLIDKGWPPRYAARRIAWHVLDHAWEIEDRTV
jgi:hypothetical protein